MGNGGLGDQESPGDFIGCQAAEQAQSQSQSRIPGEDRMAGNEDEAQQVVAHVFICVSIDFQTAGSLFGLKITPYSGWYIHRKAQVYPTYGSEMITEPLTDGGCGCDVCCCG